MRNTNVNQSIIRVSGAMIFRVEKKCSTTKARVSKMMLAHATADTPMFMPVGTKGTMKGITSDQLKNLGPQVILGNTYHLALMPVLEL